MRASNLLAGAGAVATATVGPPFLVNVKSTSPATYRHVADVRDLDTIEILNDVEFRKHVETGLRQAHRGELLSFEEVFGERL